MDHPALLTGCARVVAVQALQAKVATVIKERYIEKWSVNIPFEVKLPYTTAIETHNLCDVFCDSYKWTDQCIGFCPQTYKPSEDGKKKLCNRLAIAGIKVALISL